MPSEVHASVNLGLSKGQHRTVFRNPRGLKYYYAFYIDDATNNIFYEKSADGTTWTTAPVQVESIDTDPAFDVKIHDTGSQLEVRIVITAVSGGNGFLTYRRGDIGDALSSIGWDATQDIRGVGDPINEIMGGPLCCAIARTDNGELVVAFVEDFNTMGRDYRRTMLIGSDGDGASPTWSGEMIWDDPSVAGANNDLKGDVWFGLETMSGDRVLLYARVPEATNSSNYEVATAVPTWDQGGNDFENTTANKAISGPNSIDGKIISGLVDEADRGHIIYFDGNNTRLDSRRAASVDDDDWGSAITVLDENTDACTLTLDTVPATDEIYAFFHPSIDAVSFSYKKTPIDTISWSDETRIVWGDDTIALTSWSRDVESSLHIGIEDADTDVWYYEHVVTVPADPIPDRLYEVEQHINRSSTY